MDYVMNLEFLCVVIWRPFVFLSLQLLCIRYKVVNSKNVEDKQQVQLWKICDDPMNYTVLYTH